MNNGLIIAKNFGIKVTQSFMYNENRLNLEY